MSHLPTSPQNVPVFNCIVHVAPRDADGTVVARVVNLPGIEARGKSEREALAEVVTAFKIKLAGKVDRGEPVVLTEPPPLAAGETQRLIAVHL